jgi:hypothetical protein
MPAKSSSDLTTRVLAGMALAVVAVAAGAVFLSQRRS